MRAKVKIISNGIGRGTRVILCTDKGEFDIPAGKVTYDIAHDSMGCATIEIPYVSALLCTELIDIKIKGKKISLPGHRLNDEDKATIDRMHEALNGLSFGDWLKAQDEGYKWST